jgi:phosphoribosyl-AMP cyclohydrolase / phosphoribosyl-ATP pyrophosphohydrolase
MTIDEKAVKYDDSGLVPCIVQDTSGEVRMLAYMNAESLARTLATGKVTFYSRSRKALWQKGETSGHYLHVSDLRLDCDGDAILVRARCEGPTCHRNLPSCFSDEAEPEQTLLPDPHGIAFLGNLEDLLRARKAKKSLEGSYTERLFFQGIDRIAKKVVEEAGEVVIAAKTVESHDSPEARTEFLGEAADLLFHLDMLLVHHGASLAEAVRVLEARHAARAPGSKEA